MANVKKIEDEDLLYRLSGIFKIYGYEGASLTLLAEATGLKRPSLYHRFPRGKEQMAEEVLSFTYRWIEVNILEPLKKEAPPEDKVKLFVVRISQIYSKGKEACLLNMLSTTKSKDNPFAASINTTFKVLQNCLSDIAVQNGLDTKDAQRRAENVLVEIQGALVLSRGTGATGPFIRMLQRLPEVLLGDSKRR